MKVKIKLLDEMLGTCCANLEVHEEFIASKSADADKVKEELAALPANELMKKIVTVFPRDDDGMPIMFDYQFKGFIKHAMGVLSELSEKEIKIGKTKLSKWTFKRIVDSFVFVYPRKIRLVPVSGICTRPLRASTMQGERISLASSEAVPAGTEFEIEIKTLTPVLDELIERCLDYGQLNGLLQWRNSGKGRFAWTKCQ